MTAIDWEVFLVEHEWMSRRETEALWLAETDSMMMIGCHLTNHKPNRVNMEHIPYTK